MTITERYLDLSQPDPPIRAQPSVRVSHLVAHPVPDGFSRCDQVAWDFGLSRNAVFAAWSYYLQNRDEINQAIADRNAAYREDQS